MYSHLLLMPRAVLRLELLMQDKNLEISRMNGFQTFAINPKQNVLSVTIKTLQYLMMRLQIYICRAKLLLEHMLLNQMTHASSLWLTLIKQHG